MANLSQIKREKMLHFLETLKEQNNDDESLMAINRIEKELTAKKYGLVWEEHEEEVDVKMRTHIPVFTEDKEKEIIGNPESDEYNFLLEGDNLHSLKLLEKTHKGKIDVIYIDPPYNTGAKDWKYNNNYVDKVDTYRHSKWISMMHSRMIIAKKLLKDDGVFICAIDENELGNLLLLIEDVFGIGYSADPISIVHNPRGIQGDNFSYVNEYAIFVYKRGYKVVGERIVKEEDIDWSPLRNWGSESERNDARNCFYPIYVKNGEIIGFGDVTSNEIHPKQTEYNAESDIYSVYPIDVKGVERKWRYARQTVDSIRNLLRAKKTKNGFDIEIGKNYAPYKTVWTEKKYDANEYGTQLISSMIPNNEFSFPKSIYNVYDCLYAVVRDRNNAIVLDYFAGSGTTGHAIMMLNKNIGGNRKFILCTNNEVGENRVKEFRKKYGEIIESSQEWERWTNNYGIARSVTYPRIKSAINGFIHTKDFKDILYQKKITPAIFRGSDKILKEIDEVILKYKGNYDDVKINIEENNIVVMGIKKKGETIEGLSQNVMFYKTDFVPFDEEDLTEKLLEHIIEMIQLQYGVKVDNKKYVIIMDDDEMDEFEKNFRKYTELKALFINQDVLLTTSQEKLLSNVNTYIIPDCYFDSELREAGELW